MDEHHLPDLTNLRQAFQTACKYVKKDMLVVLQSSTYPGTTEEEFLPLLEKTGLKVGQDFHLAHVPETADPGNPHYCFNEVPKIISGITPSCREAALELYKSAGFKVYPCPSTKVAESAKILQNAFRLVNISFINEVKVMLDRMGVDVWDVIAAASTKPFGFMPFYPSPGAGGDCIPVDSEYLIWKARVTEGPTTLLEMAEHINRSMPHYVVEKVVEGLNRHEKSIHHTSILVLGVSYKKDVNDIRESAALSILFQLKQMQAKVEYHDPFIKKLPPIHRYPGMEFQSIDFDYEKLDKYDAIVIGTDHTFYDWDQIVAKSKLVIDPYNATAKVSGSKNKIVKA
jgi:UDP-N-acetyl-D-glucosamine dehydrogenase